MHTCRKPVHTYTSDGIDIDRCRHVTVSDCIINIADIRIANVQLDAMRFLYLYPGHSTEAEFCDVVFSGVSGKVQKPSYIRSVPGKPVKNLVLRDFRLPRDFDIDGTELRFE